MKKRFAILLAATMLLLSACGGTTPAGQPSSSSSPGQTGAPNTGNAPAQPPIGGAIQFDPSATIEETVLVDDGYLNADIAAVKNVHCRQLQL